MKSSGFIPRAAARSSSALRVRKHACGWFGARQARELAVWVGTDECCCLRLGIWKT
jgi:hypothetical protein